ncbi:hypothetical protein CXB51_024794 [Gossypium anomalum]|uniref:Uncharacterized protein n=1 Tax=Gossypium anomalum TaxID=47600 RepID=A0A8J6CUB0_9ROSI|nr:hypothetical protein CXB51_024794 [Gossypium anomalum]
MRWFTKVESLSENVLVNCRRTFGVPIHACPISTFKNIANHWGSFISVDDGTAHPKSFVKGNISFDCFPELSVGAKAFTNLWFHNQMQAQKGESDDTNQASSERNEISSFSTSMAGMNKKF